MTDYIDRQAAINEIQRFLGYIDQDMIDRIKIGLRKLPTIEAEPVKHGRWINDNGLYKCSVRCSNCDEQYIAYPGEFKYCPNCGMKMVNRDG